MTTYESQEVGSDLVAGREFFGVTGRYEYGPLGETLRQSRLSSWPALLLGLAGSLFPAQLLAAVVVRGRMESALGPVTAAALPVVAVLALAATSVIALRLQDRSRSRVPLVVASAGGLAASSLVAGTAGGRWALMGGAVLAGAAGGFATATHWPLLVDVYRPEVRVRAFGLYGGALAVGVGSAMALIAMAARGTMAWRASYLVLALAALVVAALLATLRDVARARWDGERFASLVENRLGGHGTHGAALDESEVTISEVEKLRRVLAVPSAGPVLLLANATGLAWIALPTYGAELLRARFDVPLGRGHGLLAVTWAAALLLLPWWARRGEVQFRYRPELLLASTAWAGSLAAIGLAAAAVSPSVALVVVCFALVHAGLVVVLVGTAVSLLAVAPPMYRAQAAVLLGLSGLAGAVGSYELMGTFSSRFGVRWGLIVAAALVVLVSNAVRPALRQVPADLDAVIHQVHEAVEIRVAVSQGKHLPLLSCRKVDFSYGQLQVLFGVDFTVDDGEMVALLGTNGAGKSTLLRAISGLGAVDRGSIHYRGRDVTFLGTDRRVELGISQIPGGRAVFGPMTVADNLRVYGYTCGRDRRRVEAGIDTAFDAFPRLAERRNQPAATLSGGEQQMLGLAKALILGPRLLLIDELSLGLAPVVVGDLLQMVRTINDEGTAVVLVEQSVNIALSLVEHAYFMEKGEMRFDGRAEDLLARPDLLRSVFLEGASKGMS